ncbi:MAG TPA: plastocyanin/azurin family copper-binding protein [Acetobacteraceae bacterium]|jgi:plastocyanin
MRVDAPILAATLLIAAIVQAHADGVTVYQEGKKFSETEVTVKVGESVTFTNKDPVTHNVYSDTPGLSFDLKTQKPDTSTTISFDHAGLVTVRCAIHPQMVMQVNVQ